MMPTDVVLWRMRHRASGAEMVCQIVNNELLLTVAGEPIPIADRIRDVLSELPKDPRHQPLLMQLAMRDWPDMFVRGGWRMEDEA